MDNSNNTKPKNISATVKKPSLVKEIFKYVIEEEIEPRSKEIASNMLTSSIGMIADGISKGVNRFIYPEGAPTKQSQKSGSKTYSTPTNYTVYSRSNSEQNKPQPITQRSSCDVNYIWVDSKANADEIINTLKELIDNYGKAKVSDLYEKLTDENGNKISPNFTDFKYGWSEKEKQFLRTYQEVSGPNRGKWFIDLPRPVDVSNI